jgi:hypothetical protein
MADLFPKSVDSILDDDERNTPQFAALMEMKNEACCLEHEKLNNEAHLKYEQLPLCNKLPLKQTIPTRTRR